MYVHQCEHSQANLRWHAVPWASPRSEDKITANSDCMALLLRVAMHFAYKICDVWWYWPSIYWFKMAMFVSYVHTKYELPVYESVTCTGQMEDNEGQPLSPWQTVQFSCTKNSYENLVQETCIYKSLTEPSKFLVWETWQMAETMI